MASGTVTVRGEAVVPGQPDEAQVFIEITAVEKTPQKAMADVSERSARLQDVFVELDIPEAARSTSGVTLTEETEWEGKTGRRKHVGFRAGNRVTVRLDDVDTVARLVGEATDKCEAIVRGPSWQIALANPARTEAFRAAAEDARRRAEAYASALGATLGDVLSVIEPGLAVRTHQRHEVALPPPAAAPSRVAAPAPEVQVDAGALDIPAAVEVTFALEQK
ncbi:MAG TPA: SIMPL domain-containing protein [Actinomycetota bacterium]|nr:SIMPL domain-containing protein [Actinomycetota bacterium]